MDILCESLLSTLKPSEEYWVKVKDEVGCRDGGLKTSTRRRVAWEAENDYRYLP